jgi:hypothetical protein
MKQTSFVSLSKDNGISTNLLIFVYMFLTQQTYRERWFKAVFKN